MIFRGFDIFMKGIDPRDAHFITSRICGICGDNHCTCSCLNQNMAYGVKPPPLGDLRLQPGRVGGLHVRPRDLQRLHGERGLLRADGQGDQPDACSRRPRSTPSPHRDIHGYKTIADIMRALNPFTGELLPRDAARGPLHARDVLPVRRPPHAPVDDHARRLLAPTSPTRRCTDYYVRLMRYIDYVKRTVPMHDDLYDFFLQELPGYDMVGFRETNLVNWGCFDDPGLRRLRLPER